MPLKKGSSRKTLSKNVKTEMHAYEKSGKIGNSKPASKKKAQKQAVAIAYSKARESGAKLPKKSAAAKSKSHSTKSKSHKSSSKKKSK